MHKPADLLVTQIPRLRRYARALTGDVNRADDLVQDCLARALPRLKLWKPGTDMRAWLFTIMHNLFVNECRRQRKQPDMTAFAADDVPGPYDNSEADVRLSELQSGLQRLAPEQREVLLLVSIEGLSYQQVAGVLGIPNGTVMSRLHRGRQQLRKWMSGEPCAASGLRSVK
ncbi:MAG: sigma-70 family RNA polymerase sigma factor [Gammaproteobacteria bacterium]|nr:MAG: sigma-70 family RNA polymerase sigma factor [Gammaproteobacteria bacterium]